MHFLKLEFDLVLNFRGKLREGEATQGAPIRCAAVHKRIEQIDRAHPLAASSLLSSHRLEVTRKPVSQSETAPQKDQVSSPARQECAA